MQTESEKLYMCTHPEGLPRCDNNVLVLICLDQICYVGDRSWKRGCCFPLLRQCSSKGSSGNQFGVGRHLYAMVLILINANRAWKKTSSAHPPNASQGVVAVICWSCVCWDQRCYLDRGPVWKTWVQFTSTMYVRIVRTYTYVRQNYSTLIPSIVPKTWVYC